MRLLPLARPRRSRLALVLLLATVAAAAMADGSSSGGDDDDSSSSVPSLSSMDVYDALALAFMAVGLAVSSAGGVGGGVIMVPAMVLIMSFDIKHATPISNMAILGGALANAFFNLRKRHPHVDRPLIDADLAVAMIPTVIGGTVIGTLLSKLLPSYIVSLLFVVVLFAGGVRTTQKGIRLHKKEVAKQKATDAQDGRDVTSPVAVADAAPSPSAYVEAVTPQPSGTNDVAREKRLSLCESLAPKTTEGGEEDGAEATLAQIVEQERHFSWLKHGAIMVCYLGVVATSIADAAVSCGGVAYWVILLIEIPWVVIFVVLTSPILLKAYRRKIAVNYPFLEGDVRWTKKTVTWFPLGCAVAGIVAGLFGVGGGIISGPIMIEMNVVPEVAQATTALMILYSSAAATAKFAVFDMIAWDWAGVLCALAFVVTGVSQIFILGFVRRTGRQSIIVLCIGASVLVGAVLMTYEAIKVTIDDAGDAFSIDICD